VNDKDWQAARTFAARCAAPTTRGDASATISPLLEVSPPPKRMDLQNLFTTGEECFRKRRLAANSTPRNR
jgi:hypothetical protein